MSYVRRGPRRKALDILESLPDREKAILKDMYGLERSSDISYFEDIPLKYNTTEDELNQIELHFRGLLMRPGLDDDEKEEFVDELNALTEREQKILVLRYGLRDGKKRSLEEVAKEFNVTDRRINQIERKALRRLRSVGLYHIRKWADGPVIEGELCPECGRPLVLVRGLYAYHAKCTGYPECKYSEEYIKKIGVKCPECGGEIIEIPGKYEYQTEYICENAPECRTHFDYEPSGKKCPKCGTMMAKGMFTLSCPNKKCGYTEENEEARKRFDEEILDLLSDVEDLDIVEEEEDTTE